MKYLFFSPVFLFFISPAAIGQSREVIRVPAGSDIAAAVSESGLYRLPAFTKGTVYFKDGNIGKELMNYNILSAQILYIDKRGDTLAIAAPEEIKKLDINGAIFYYNNKNYLEEIAATPAVSLVMQRNVSVHFEKIGAYGNTDPSGSITSYNTYVAGVGTGNAAYRLFVNEDAVVKKQELFYLLSKYNIQEPASRRGFLAMFPKNRKNIESYLDNNKVNFNSTSDLLQLLSIAASAN